MARAANRRPWAKILAPTVREAMRHHPWRAQLASLRSLDSRAFLAGWVSAWGTALGWPLSGGQAPADLVVENAVDRGVEAWRARLERGSCPLCGDGLAFGDQDSTGYIPCARRRACGFQVHPSWLPPAVRRAERVQEGPD